MELVKVNGEWRIFGRAEALKLIIAMPHCPKCMLLPAEHNDEKCPMRWAGDNPKEPKGETDGDREKA
jgi:hypothetical protein